MRFMFKIYRMSVKRPFNFISVFIGVTFTLLNSADFAYALGWYGVEDGSDYPEKSSYLYFLRNPIEMRRSQMSKRISTATATLITRAHDASSLVDIQVDLPHLATADIQALFRTPFVELARGAEARVYQAVLNQSLSEQKPGTTVAIRVICPQEAALDPTAITLPYSIRHHARLSSLRKYNLSFYIPTLIGVFRGPHPDSTEDRTAFYVVMDMGNSTLSARYNENPNSVPSSLQLDICVGEYYASAVLGTYTGEGGMRNIGWTTFDEYREYIIDEVRYRIPPGPMAIKYDVGEDQIDHPLAQKQHAHELHFLPGKLDGQRCAMSLRRILNGSLNSNKHLNKGKDGFQRHFNTFIVKDHLLPPQVHIFDQRVF
jgi:hypothetical protein